MNNIRRVPLFDKQLIIKFLNDNWGSAHPLVNNDTFFNYYYVDGHMTNFYVLEEDDGIAAICGYIKCSENENSDIWVSIWCAKKGKNGLGLALMGAMKELTGANVIACNNIRQNTMPFYTFLGYHPDKLDHYYRLADMENYKIATVNAKIIPDSFIMDGVAYKEFANIEEIKAEFAIPNNLSPKKDYWYINRRYFEYPYYEYKIFGIYIKDECKALSVFRINESDEGFVLRLVDFIGVNDDFYLLSGIIDELMAKYSCEYCDMYSFGINGEDAGFVKRTSETNIIPNYLNPLLSKNIDYYFFTSDVENFTMFKADGDQDRKNIE